MNLVTKSRDGGRSVGIMALAAFAAAILAGGSSSGQQRRAPEKLGQGASCLSKDCHDKLAGGKTLHRPVAKKTCDVCHEQDEETEHKFTYPDSGSELCYGCHKSVTRGRHVHAPLKDKKRPCISCHDPHSGAGRGLLRAGTTTAQCLKCHAGMAAGPRLHKSPAAKGCTGCHEPHSSGLPKLARSAQPGLCYSCHEGLKEDLAEAKVVHGPVSAGCVCCHDPHRPGAGKGVKIAGAGLCMTCHDHFKARLSAMSKRHSKLLEKRQCLRCHDPHGAGRKSLLLKAAGDLCLSCHDKQIKSPGGRAVRSLAGELAQGARLHGPVAGGNCGACHEPHGNAKAAFLRKDYPATFYSPYSPGAYALCFSCHDSSLAADKHTVGATKFRNATLNLHYVHVNKARKGRTCRACHAAHGTTGPHMLADSVPFGKWKIPIRFTATRDGGRCASGCHASRSYSRTKPAADKTPKPKAPPKADRSRQRR